MSPTFNRVTSLARNPQLVLADEPTGNVNVATGERIMTITLAKETGGRVDFEALDLRDFQQRQESFEELAGYLLRRATLIAQEHQFLHRTTRQQRRQPVADLMQ